MSGDDGIRRLTAASVLLVAAIAAVVSFLHIEDLALAHGQAVLAALLLPVSVDGTVVVSSLVMLRTARAGLATPWLARSMLAFAVLATLAANIGYGLPYGWPGALISGWPAVAFIGCAEMAIGTVRRAARAAPDVPVAVPAAAKVPSVRDIRARQNCGQQTAEKVRAELKAALNGSAR